MSLHITLKNEKTVLNQIENIKIGLSVIKFNEEIFTDIKMYNKSKNYWEIKLNNREIEEIYDISISKNSNLLTDSEKQLLISKKQPDESLVLRIDIFVDEGSPIKIYNHFINE